MIEKHFTSGEVKTQENCEGSRLMSATWWTPDGRKYIARVGDNPHALDAIVTVESLKEGGTRMTLCGHPTHDPSAEVECHFILWQPS